MPCVDVCLCTFRRDSVTTTLASLAGQVLPDGVAMRVIVADNDDTPSARAAVAETVAGTGDAFDLLYVHAPARNISVARNACLDAAAAPLIAFLDDDEIAPPGWLGALVERMRASDAAIVLGPVAARYGADLPAWVADADLHSTTPAIRADGAIDTGYSCNVLFRRDILNGARFDVALGRTGGEDDVFFSTLHRAGHAIAFAPDAVLFEPVPPARGGLRWLMRRQFRNGQTYAGIRLSAGDGRAALVAKAGGKALACATSAVVQCASPAGWRRAMVRGALHAGAVSRALGKRELQLY